MITAIRVEAVGVDPGQCKQEIDTILDHMRQAGHYEGIVPHCGEIKDEVYPRRRMDDEIRGVAGGRFAFDFDGRKVIEFMPDEDPGFEPQRPEPLRDTTVFVKGDDVTETKIVLDRLLPMDWPDEANERWSRGMQTIETTAEAPGTADVLLERLAKIPGVEFTITPIPLTDLGERWRINVSFNEGRLGFHTLGGTISNAAADALGQISASGYPGHTTTDAHPAGDVQGRA